MPYHVYILRSRKSGRFYTGHAEDVPHRLAEHNSGKVVATRSKGPWELLHTEEFPTRAAAASRERQIKRMKSRSWIEQLVRASR